MSERFLKMSSGRLDIARGRQRPPESVLCVWVGAHLDFPAGERQREVGMEPSRGSDGPR